MQEKFALIREHIQLSIQFKKEEKQTIAMMRKFLSKYLKGMHGFKELLSRLNATKTVKEALEALQLFEDSSKSHYSTEI